MSGVYIPSDSSPLLHASPEAMSDYDSASNSYFTLPESQFDEQDPVLPDYADQISALVAEFYRDLAVYDGIAAANTAEGESSKSGSSPDNPSLSVPLVSCRTNAKGFGGGRIVCQTVEYGTKSQQRRQRKADQAFKLQPAPLWTKRKGTWAVMPFREIAVGETWAGRRDLVHADLYAPRPTAKVSTYLESIPGTSSDFPNLFCEDVVLSLSSPGLSDLPTEPELSSLDSFSPYFDFKGFEADGSFDLPDMKIRALFLMRELVDILERLTRRYGVEQ